MKFAAAVAALLAALAMPALAQHGSVRAGSGAHSAGVAHAAAGFHGGFRGGFAPRSSGFAPRFGGFAPHLAGPGARFRGFSPRSGFPARSGMAPRWGASRAYRFTSRRPTSMRRIPYREYNYGAGRGRTYGGNRYDRFRDRHRGHGHDHDHDRMPYGTFYSGFNGYPYLNGYSYPYWSYPIDLDPWLFSSDDANDSTNGSATSNQSAAAPGPNYGEAAPAPSPDSAAAPYPDYGSYNPAPQPAYSPRPLYRRASPESHAAPQPSVTVLFKNGRAPEKIQNYMLTASTLTVLDPHYQQIPLNQIDIPATQAANRADGVDFQVPSAAR